MSISFQGSVAKIESAAPDGYFVHFTPDGKVCGYALLCCRVTKEEQAKWPLGAEVTFTIAASPAAKK